MTDAKLLLVNDLLMSQVWALEIRRQPHSRWEITKLVSEIRKISLTLLRMSKVELGLAEFRPEMRTLEMDQGNTLLQIKLTSTLTT